MRYSDGNEIKLGDVVSLDIPDSYRTARVVMLGDSREHLELEQSFLEWVSKEPILDEKSIVVEWIGQNPFDHNDPHYAPVGNYMFTGIDEWVTLIKRNDHT